MYIPLSYLKYMLPRWLSGKESAYSVLDTDSVPGSGRSLEKGMATLSSILAWEIPWTEEPGAYSPWGPQRIGHDPVTKQQQT